MKWGSVTVLRVDQFTSYQVDELISLRVYKLTS